MAEPVGRNFCTHLRVKLSLGPSRKCRMLLWEQSCHQAIMFGSPPLTKALIAYAWCARGYCDIIIDESAQKILCPSLQTQLKLLNIMFHVPMGRFQLELFIFVTYFSTVVPLNVVFSFL